MKINDADLYYEIQGNGSETILFAHGLLWSGRMYSGQVDGLKSEFRCVRFDFRGQGRSQITAAGYSIEQLTADTISLIESLNLAPIHFVGLSMGGFVGMRIAAARPDLVRSLTLLNTSADPETPRNRRAYLLLTNVASWFGIRLVVSRVMSVMFGRSFLKNPEFRAERDYWKNELISSRISGIKLAVRGVVDRSGAWEMLPKISAPTLVVVGSEDRATPPRKGEAISRAIPNSRLVRLPECGHSSTIEKPESILNSLRAFLRAVSSNTEDRQNHTDVVIGEAQ